MKRTVTIVGAGLCGALLAVYLARRGYGVQVYEGRPDLRLEKLPAGRSINLALANRGIRALDEVGLHDEVKKLLIPMRGRMIHDPDGTLTLQPYGQRETEVIHSISRPGLNALLLSQAERAGAQITFNQRLAEIDLASGDFELDGQHGTRTGHHAAPLLATDGARSLVRRTMAQSPGGESTEENLDHAYKELRMAPAADGKHAMDANALHIWPRGGFMLIALPNLDGSFTVTLFLARSGEPSFESLRDDAAVEAFFAEYFPDAVAHIPNLVDDFFINPTGVLSTVRCRPWHVAERICLLGDAAHAIVPFHGQGMNCAFEDCYEFDRCLEDAGTPDQPDWRAVFEEFSERRRPNAEAIADMALENYVEMRDSVNDPRFQLKKKLAFALEKRWPHEFVPRYSMIMFHHLPYSEAQRRGAIQQDILDTLIGEREDLEGIDYDLAKRLIDERLDTVAF